MIKNYNIGLDIGTTSVGWAVVDDNANVIKKGKHPLWGVRLFNEAETAVSRRLSRGTRRRFDRRRARIQLLRDEFKDYISQDFFQILNEGFLDNIDKTIKIEGEYADILNKYQKEYKTIYHLRKRLIEDCSKEDIRLVYLALHHMIKYRGNFLREGENFGDGNNISDISASINQLLDNLKEYDVIYKDDDISVDNLVDAFKLKSKTDKKNYIKNVFKEINIEYKSFAEEFSKVITGGKAKVGKMFSIELEKDIEFSFSGTSLDDNYALLEETLGDKIDVIDCMKTLYDALYLNTIFKGMDKAYISYMMVNTYDKFKEDKKLLKEVFKNSGVFSLIFDRDKKDEYKEDKKHYYERYVNGHISQEDFYKALTTLSLKIKDENKLKIFNEIIFPQIEDGVFLPKITTTNNSMLPYQLNEIEMRKILENQGVYYPFLLEKINDDYKIIQLLKFRIPYYVGPLGSYNNDNYWMVRKENMDKVKITPYNFNDVVDYDASAEKFITRMISNCTYLLKEKAIPANSILYSEYKVLNEIKQIRINNDSNLDVELQKYIYNELFLKYNSNITFKLFEAFVRLNSDKFAIIGDEIKITGFSSDNGFANNMKSYHDFFGVDGVFKDTHYDNNFDAAEEIITWLTVFEDKKIVQRKIEQKYGDLPNESINKILKLKYSGWSKLSKKLLCDLRNKNGESYGNSIMDLMRNTDKNFMQIINSTKYKFQDLIAKENGNDESQDKFRYEQVDLLATSPANKRGIWQSLKVVDAIVKKMGYEPSNISIEFARNEDIKQRTESRKKKIETLYKNFNSDIESINASIKKELDSFEESELKNKKLFLYFMQNGKSLYSGKPLSIDNLEETTEIDHIIPRSIYKDDSFDNVALVLKEENQIKSGKLVLPPQYRTDELIKWWESLKKNGLITQRKIDRLKRNYYSDNDVQGFINRQLVETRQITKHVANILKNHYKNTNLIYLHADLSHQYRNKFELFKYRDLNDLHHAHDAYLAIVLGLYKNKYFNKKVPEVILEQVKELMKNNKDIQNKLKSSYIINSLDNEYGSYFSEALKEEIIKLNQTIEYNMYRNDILVSYKVYESDGKLYNDTKYSKDKKSDNKIPIKKFLDVNKYGYYSGKENCYFSLVEVKGKKRIIIVPLYMKNSLLSYLEDLFKVDKNDIKILIDKIYKGTFINYCNHIVYLAGGRNKACEVKNAVQLKLHKEILINDKLALNYVLNGYSVDVNKDILSNSLDKLLLDLKKYIVYYPLYELSLSSYFSEYSNTWDLEAKRDFIYYIFAMFKMNSLTIEKKIGNSSIKNRLADKAITSGKIIYTDILGLNEEIY